eukprot:2468204-Alexandrium_andersonii.AAC.1
MALPCVLERQHWPPDTGRRLQLDRPGASWGLRGPPPPRDPGPPKSQKRVTYAAASAAPRSREAR